MSTVYDYYPAVLYALDKISQGHTTTSACDQSNLPIPTFEAYIKRDVLLQEMRMDAERRGYDAMADALLTITSEKTIHGESDPKMAKIKSDNIKWLLSKRRNKEYGDKLLVQHDVTMDKAIIDALEKGTARALSGDVTPNIIDVTPNAIDAEVEYLPRVQSEAELLAEILS